MSGLVFRKALFSSILLILTFICSFAVAATPTATPNPDAIPEATLSPYAAEYSEDHPEKLNADQLYAYSAILIEASSGDIIFDKDAYQVMYPASTTKMLTVWLGITMVDDLDMEVTVSETAIDVPDDSSTMKLKAGEVVSFRDVLYGTMLLSANDGANVIAETVSGSIPAFVDLMNYSATEVIGCTSTHFANAHGYHDDNHYTTAADLALIAQTAMRNPTFREIASTYSYTLAKTNMNRSRTISNSNELMMPSTDEKTNKYYYPFANGIKTGSTSKAGYCFVGAATKDNVELISVILFSAKRNRWVDTKKLFEYGFSQYTSVTPVDLYNMNPITIETSGYSLSDTNLGKLRLNCVPASHSGTSKANIIATYSQVEAMAANLRGIMYIQFVRDFVAPINENDVIGTMTYFTETGEEIEYNLVASRPIAKRENAPKSISEIEEEIKNDPNPFPRMTPDMAVLILLPFILYGAALYIIVKLVYAKKHRRSALPGTRKKRQLR